MIPIVTTGAHQTHWILDLERSVIKAWLKPALLALSEFEKVTKPLSVSVEPIKGQLQYPLSRLP